MNLQDDINEYLEKVDDGEMSEFMLYEMVAD